MVAHIFPSPTVLSSVICLLIWFGVKGLKLFTIEYQVAAKVSPMLSGVCIVMTQRVMLHLLMTAMMVNKVKSFSQFFYDVLDVLYVLQPLNLNPSLLFNRIITYALLLSDLRC